MKKPPSLVAMYKPSLVFPMTTRGLPEASKVKRGQRFPYVSLATSRGSEKSHVIWAWSDGARKSAAASATRVGRTE